MFDDEDASKVGICQQLFVIGVLSFFHYSSSVLRQFPLPAFTGIGYRREALAKFFLLPLRFPLLVYVPCLLLGTWT
jgi:hypothetical protein